MSEVPTIYFAGSIRGGRELQPIYNELIEHTKGRGVRVLCEHVGYADLTDQGQKQDPAFIHDRDLTWIDESDGVIAEVTNPSLGVGYEISYAEHRAHKPVLALFHKTLANEDGRRLSAMIEGAAGVRTVEYSQLRVGKLAIDMFLEAHLGYRVPLGKCAADEA